MAIQEKRTETAPPSDAPKLALVVLGMHRSGTSALAGMLGSLGATLPQHLIPANEKNPAGYFESELLYRLHDELLEEAGTRWDDPASFPSSWFSSPSARTWTQRMVEVCREEFGNSGLFVLKDPRICRLVPFWEGVLREFGASPRYIIAVRNPLETARSLEAAERDPENIARLLWLDYFLSAERDTRDRPRCFIAYEALLANWRATRDALQEKLGLVLPRASRSAEAEIDAFLSTTLRRQSVSHEELEARDDIHPWVKGAYAWAREAARDEAPDPARLDALRTDLEIAEAAFGPALGASEAARHANLAHIEELSEELEDQQELRRKVAAFREEAQRTGESNRMLLRWMVDRVRAPDEPAPASLRTILAAAEKAKPSEIPAIASTGLVLADQKSTIEQLERELRARAARVEELATLAGKRGNQLRLREKTLEEEQRAGQRLLEECERLAAELEAARSGWRQEKALGQQAMRDRERLETECARLLEELAQATPPDGSSRER